MSDKLSVCLLNDSFPPVIDGVSNAVINYAEIIEKKYGNVVIGTPKVPEYSDNYPFPVYRYPSINTTKLVGYRAGYPFDASVINAMEKEKIDIIHSHCPIMSTLLARTIRKTKDVPIILTYHTKFDVDLQKAVKSNLIKTMSLKFLEQNIYACDEVWAVSKGAGENMRNLGYYGDYVVMENGVDFPKGRASAEKTAQLRAQYNIPEGMPLFLFVGRLRWYKGIQIILDALKIAKEQGEQFRMLIVGDGNDRQEMKEYTEKIGISDICTYVGAVSDRELLRVYFCAADLFLFPSTYDTNGIVVREAAACSLGSVLIKDSCAAEGVEDGRNGILIEENAEALGAVVIDACHNLDGIHRIGENAANDLYISWEDSVAKAYERYQIVLDRKKSMPPVPPREEKKKDEFFGLVADICAAIDKVQESGDKIKTKVQENSDRLKTKVQENSDRLKTKVQENTDKIKETKEKITEKLYEKIEKK